MRISLLASPLRGVVVLSTLAEIDAIAASGSGALVVVVAPTVVGVRRRPPVVVVAVVDDLLSPHDAPINTTATSATAYLENFFDPTRPPSRRL